MMKTNRLLLRPYEDKDRERICELLMNEEIKKTFMIPDITLEQAEAYFQVVKERSYQEGQYERVICLGEKVIGFLNNTGIEDHKVEIGYVIHPDHHNHGYASEALSGAIQELFQLGYSCVTAGAFKANTPSIRVMEKCGMKKLDRCDKVTYRDREWDCVYYAIEKEQ